MHSHVKKVMDPGASPSLDLMQYILCPNASKKTSPVHAHVVAHNRAANEDLVRGRRSMALVEHTKLRVAAALGKSGSASSGSPYRGMNLRPRHPGASPPVRRIRARAAHTRALRRHPFQSPQPLPRARRHVGGGSRAPPSPPLLASPHPKSMRSVPHWLLGTPGAGLLSGLSGLDAGKLFGSARAATAAADADAAAAAPAAAPPSLLLTAAAAAIPVPASTERAQNVDEEALRWAAALPTPP